MAFRVYPVRPKTKLYCFIKRACSECGLPHFYPKVGMIKDRFDGRKFKYVCWKEA